MVRSVGIAAVVLGLAWAGLAGAQTSLSSQAAPPRQRYITVREEGKPPQRCQLLKSWHEPNGVPVYQVQAVDTREVMTIVGSSPPGHGGDPRAMSTRIFRWGNSNRPPAGAPLPPHPARATASLPAPSPLQAKQVVTPQPIRRAPQPSAPTQLAKTPQPIGAAPTARTSPTVPATPLAADRGRGATAPQVVAPGPTIHTPMPALPTITTGKPTPPVVTQATPSVITQTPPLAPGNAAAPRLIAPGPSFHAPVPAQPAITTKTPSVVTQATPSVVTQTKPLAPSNLPPLTPMSTQVVQQSPVRKPDVQNSTPSTPPQPRLVPSANAVVGQTSGECCCPQACNACGQPCNPCQPSCVCCTPSPMRQSFISRLFKSHPDCACTETACQPAPAPAPIPGPAPKPVVATPPAPVVAKATTEPARPRDWRESWGKVEPWKEGKTTTQAAPVKPVEKSVSQQVTAKPNQAAPVKPVEKIVSQRLSPKPVELEAPKQPDPLRNPDLYRNMALDTHLANSKIPQEKQPAPAPRPKPRLFAAKRLLEPNPPPPPPQQPPVTAAATPNAPSPMQSPGRVVQLPANEGNAFWTPPEPPAPKKEPGPKFNAFDRDPNNPPKPGVPPRMAPGYAGPLPPRGPMPLVRQQPLPNMPSRPDMGVSDAMGNAFTLPGTRRPIPADFGGTPQEPNGFDTYVQMGQGSPPQGYGMMSNRMAMAPRMPMGTNPFMSAPVAPGRPMADARPGGAPQLLAKLQDSLYPSEREAAAEQLSELSWRGQPQVVASLMKAARDDPAATVRAACVHALAHMKVETKETLALVRKLQSDHDPRVRHEAEEALNALGDSSIRQASHEK